ncbi:MAG: hypothetical protein K9N38_03595 [Candidatus Marinimicrobia bacterium]|nr:hypothetical protein [Candidatus Neomarinimicrobiota bacterium]MCF7850495.1 hypothetical protein [Candidatus Neomarinimicrobiota bacterium]
MKDEARQTPFLNLYILIYKNFKKLFIFNFIVGLLALIYVFTLPLSYRSTASVVVQSESGSGGLAAMVSQFSPFPISLGGGAEVQKFMGVLETKRVMDVIIEEFDLQNLYEKKTRVETYRTILESLELFDREDGSFSISYTIEDDPELAKRIVEALYTELVKIMLELNQANAFDYRMYMENAYESAAEELRESEIAFNQFQKETGIVSLEDQTIATIGAVTELELEKVKREIELDYLRQTLTPDHPDVQSKMLELAAFKKKLAEIKHNDESYLVAVDQLPDNSLAYLRHFRDVTVNSKLSEFLALQLEQARMEEQKETVNLYLLDPPEVPDRKYKPRRLSILVIIMFFSVVFSVGYFLIKDYFWQNRDIIQSKLS